MIDVSQVLEFPSAKRYLFKQLTVTKITHIGTLKLPLNRSCLFGGGRLIERALILPHKDFENRAPYKKNLFKYSSLRCENCENLNYTLTKSYFYIMVFNEKYSKLMLLLLIPLLKLVVCLSITDNIVSAAKPSADDTSIFDVLCHSCLT